MLSRVVMSSSLVGLPSLMPCLHETRLREVNAFLNSIENVMQCNRNVNLPQVNVSRVNTA